MAEIEQNASDQAQEVTKIADSFSDILKVTEETLAASQEVAAASEQQKAALAELSRMFDVLRKKALSKEITSMDKNEHRKVFEKR